MSDIDYQQIIKWIIIVIAAGFLGQFGKSFATYLIEKARKKKALSIAEKSGIPDKEHQESISPTTTIETSGTDAKAKKKAMKALVKQRKKGGGL